MAVVGLDGFVQYLARSELLGSAQMEEVTGRLQAQYPQPRELARELMRRDWLTAYQVNLLVQGRDQELTLGPYILLERLGEGGMGQVFKARHRQLGRIVALKVLRREMLDNSIAVRRFHREVQAVAQMSHPNIVRAFDADEVCGTLYLAMEYMEGTDLARMVRQSGPLSVVQACDYIRQAALGLQHAHECGLVHRDIKPANLLVTRDGGQGSSALLVRPGRCMGRWGTVKILDMGLARLQEPDHGAAGSLLTQLGSVMGTPDFIAPEQVRNSHACDIRADIYALGATLYFVLCGQVPFPEGSVTDKLLQHQLDDPLPVEDARRARLLGDESLQVAGNRRLVDIPPPVGQLVRRMMAKSPEERPQTPAAVAEALTAMLNKARPSGTMNRRPSASALMAATKPVVPATARVCAPAPAAAPARSAGGPARGRSGERRRPRRSVRQTVRKALQSSRKVLVYGGFLLVCLVAARAAPRGGPAVAAGPPAVAPARGSPLERLDATTPPPAMPATGRTSAAALERRPATWWRRSSRPTMPGQ
jgi:serine/threonine protein kinase